MAYYQIKMFSNSLVRGVNFDMIIPNDTRKDIPIKENDYSKRKMKTLFLLHGYTGNAGNWVPEELAQKYNFAIVMPNGENAFYLDGLSSCSKFGTFVGEELVEYVRNTFGLAMSAEDTYIMGMSMGGFGALHAALKYPQNFGKAGAMSSALIVHDIAHMKKSESNPVANYAYYHECFGDLEKVEDSENNPEVLAKQLVEKNEKMPELYMCCGKEDFLIKNNQQFHKFLTNLKVPHEYHEGKGIHDMVFWNKYTPKIIEWMFK